MLRSLIREICTAAIDEAQGRFTLRGLSAEVRDIKAGEFVVHVKTAGHPTQFYTVKVTKNI